MRIRTALIMAMIASTGYSQTLREAVNSMPDSICMSLTKVNLADANDYVDYDMTGTVTNRFNTPTTISGEKNKYIDFQLSKSSSLHIHLLPTETGDTILCTIKSINSGKVCDSKINFYDRHWNKLPQNLFVTLPQREDFVTRNDSLTEEEYQRVLNSIDCMLTEMVIKDIKEEAGASTPQLILRMKSDLEMDKDQKSKSEPFIKKEITMTWNGKRFE